MRVVIAVGLFSALVLLLVLTLGWRIRSRDAARAINGPKRG